MLKTEMCAQSQIKEIASIYSVDIEKYMSQSAPDWSLLRSFLTVLDEGGLSQAARRLALTQPTVARHIALLEEHLGATLFTRSPRGLAPTDAALAMADHARAMRASAEALTRAASGPADAMEGVVRIAASDVIGVEVLPGLLNMLCSRHPKLRIQAVMSNDNADLLRREADVAIRMARPQQDALIAKRVGDVLLGFYARRDYLERCGTPTNWDELAGHAIVGFIDEDASVRAMRASGAPFENIRFSFATNNHLGQLGAIRAGLGVGLCQVGLGERDPELVRLLRDAFVFPLETWIVMHEDLRAVARVRAVFDHLVTAMGEYAKAN